MCDHLSKVKSYDPECLLQGPETSKLSKVVRRGARGVLPGWRKGLPRVSCTSATCFAPMQPSFAAMQQAFGPHTPNHLLHPLLKTLGNFDVSSPCTRQSGSQVKSCLHLLDLHDRHVPGCSKQGYLMKIYVPRQIEHDMLAKQRGGGKQGDDVWSLNVFEGETSRSCAHGKLREGAGKSAQTFLQKLFEHPRGLGHPDEIPGTSQVPPFETRRR